MMGQRSQPAITLAQVGLKINPLGVLVLAEPV